MISAKDRDEAYSTDEIWSMAGLKATVAGRPIASYVLLTYLISWAVWTPLIWLSPDQEIWRMVGGFGPTIAALILLTWLEGRRGLKDLGNSLLRWDVGWQWWLISLLGTAVLAGMALALHLLLGGDRSLLGQIQPLYVAALAFGYVLVTSVAGEEIGWRGFALPRLQERYSALTASLILGAAWGLWHLPLFFIPDNFHQEIPVALFLGQSFLITIFMTWLYNNTAGSLLLAHVFHTASNVTFFILPVLPGQPGGSLRPMMLTIALALVAVAVLVLANGPEKLRKDRVQERLEQSSFA